MILRLLLLAIFLPSCVTVNNQNHFSELEHRELAEKLVEITNGDADKLGREIMKTTMQPMLTNLKANGYPANKIAQVSMAIDDFIEDFISDPALNSQVVDLYVGEFSAAELKELLDFYQRPIGEKALKKLPVLFQKGANIGMILAQKHHGKFAKKLDEILGEKCPNCIE